MRYSVKDILQITGAELISSSDSNLEVKNIFFDTRRGPSGRNTLFLAIDGKNADGHQYISNAYHKLGTRNFLVTKAIDLAAFPKANILICSNVIMALQKLAIHHRSLFQIPVIGITGSNGKTIIKEWIYQICQESFSIVRSPKSYNSQLGVPLAVLKIEEEHNLGVFEAGISSTNEMQNLESVIQPTIGIISNIGDAHSAGFASIEEKLKEKLLLFQNCQKIVFCKDDTLISKHVKSVKASHISWSTTDRSATYYVQTDHTSLCINEQVFDIPFTDQISRSNAIFAIITALELGLSPAKKVELRALKMRLEMKAGINNCFLINDAYNSDFDALSSALSILNQQQKKDSNTLILSQIEESNLAEEDYLFKLSKIISMNQINRLISVGYRLESLKFDLSHLHYNETEDLLKDLDKIPFQNQNVLIKGARKYSLEKVFDQLSSKVHQTTLEIDLEAMRHNLTVYRSFLKAETKLMVVLKASGYGSGSKELSRFLAFQRVDYIAVAYIDEGVELRKSGIDLPIMVMNPEESGFHTMIRYDLEPEIYSVDQVRSFSSYLDEKERPIHLKIETGMHRLGLVEADIQKVGEVLFQNPTLKVESIFSHLVGSDDPSLDPFSLKQIQVFQDRYEKLCQLIGYQPDRHILNSNGISRFPEHQFEMVRLGIGLHGISDDEVIQSQLQKVQRLSSKIAQIKEVGIGDSVGYSRGYKADHQHLIGTINIGYADGLPRIAGNRHYSVLVNGKKAPILGNVCMDMCMIDLEGITAKVGDEVVIFGPEWPIENLARVCQTIPYELLTRLSTRIHRIFSRE